MTEAELNKALNKIQSLFDPVNRLFLRKIAAQIVKIGELSQASINRLVVMAEVTSDVDEITTELMAATGLAKTEVSKIYTQAMNDTYTDPRFTRAFSSARIVPPAQRQMLRQFTTGVALQTSHTLDNLSNTTAISAPYRAAVDRAILATGSGLTSYTDAMRRTIRELGSNGLQVYYASGAHRRLDTAVRQNILDGTRQISMHCAEEVGKALDYDAVEISAHAHSAPDHEPVQGRIFLRSEFDKMQSGQPFRDIKGRQFEGFRRPIAEWNCMHFALPFSTEFSDPRWTEKQLLDFERENNAGCVIDGKQVTIYEASQMMRKVETMVRRQKDTAVMAQMVGDDALRRTCQLNINSLAAKYAQIAKIAGLTEHRNRMVVEGFKAVKT